MKSLLSDRLDVEQASSGCRLEIVHFAQGYWPVLDNTWMPVNRLFIVLENPNGSMNYIESGEQHFELIPDHYYLIPAYYPAIFSLDSGLKFISIHFRLEYQAGIDLFSDSSQLREVHDSVMVQKIREIFEEPSVLLSSIRLNSFVFSVAADWYQHLPAETIMGIKRFREFHELIAFIEKNCHAGISVSDMAAVYHERREVFSRRFSAATGITPKLFFNRFLIRKACDLLLRHKYSVRETAFELGFESEFYFSRFFRHHTGVPPSDFKKHHFRGFLKNETDVS